jgi:hypothetical protein
MMMSPRTAVMSDYSDEISKLPPEAILGQLLFFTISAADVNLEEARRNLIDLGLGDEGLRKALRPIDAYRKSSKEFEKGFKPVDGVRSTFMVRQAGEDTEQSQRFVMLERARSVAGEKRVILYDKVAELTLNRGKKTNGSYSGDSVEFVDTTRNLREPLTHEEFEWLHSHFAGFKDHYDHLLHYMDSHAVRSFVRDFIYRLSGTCVKESGGLYFIKNDHAEKVDLLGTWVESVGSEFHALPLLNLAKQKGLIMDAFEQEAISETRRLMGEVKKILDDPSRTIEPKTFDAYGVQVAELKKKVAEYTELIGSKATDASTELQLFSRQIMLLADRIKHPKTD